MPAGGSERCVHLRETTPLAGDGTHNVYARKIGIVKNDAFELTIPR